MRKLFFLIVLLVLIFTSCVFLERKSISNEYLLPSGTDIPGWVKSENIINLTGSDIIQYNPAYSDMGIISYSECRYSFIDDNDIYINLKILRFSSVLNAYGFFSSTAGFKEWLSHKDGNEFKSDLFYLRRKGDYIIYVQNKEALPFLRKDMAQLVKTADYNIGNNYSHEELPYLKNFLKNFTDNNVIYSKKSLDEFNDIDNVFYSRMDSEKESCMIFISDRESFNKAFSLYRSIVERERYITVEALERHSAFLKINEKNYRFISVNGNILTGLWECKTISEAEALLQKINSRINKRDTGK